MSLTLHRLFNKPAEAFYEHLFIKVINLLYMVPKAKDVRIIHTSIILQHVALQSRSCVAAKYNWHKFMNIIIIVISSNRHSQACATEFHQTLYDVCVYIYVLLVHVVNILIQRKDKS